MYCTNCGRKLAEDGTPCICGSGQYEPVMMPAVEPAPAPVIEPIPEIAEPAEPITAAPVFEPAAEIPAEPVIPTPEPVAAEPFIPAVPVPVVEEPAAPVEYVDEYSFTPVAEPAAQQPVNPYAYQPAAPADPYAQRPANPYAQPVNPYVQQPPVPQPAPAYAPPAYAVKQPTAVHMAIRSVAASPLFLTAAILMSVNFVLTIVNSFIPSDITAIINTIIPILEMLDPFTYYSSMLYEITDILYEITDVLYEMQMLLAVLNLGNMILPALVLIGLWVTFASAKKNEIPGTAGLTILQIVKVISLVGAIIAAVVFVIFAVICIIALVALSNEVYSFGYYSSSDEAILTGVTVVVVVVLLVLVPVVVLALLYAIKVVTSISGAKNALRTGEAEKPASMLVAVFGFIAAGAGLLNLITLDWMSLLINLSVIGADVLFALCIIQYNKAVKPLIAPKVTPVQPMPAPPQYPPYYG